MQLFTSEASRRAPRRHAIGQLTSHQANEATLLMFIFYDASLREHPTCPPPGQRRIQTPSSALSRVKPFDTRVGPQCPQRPQSTKPTSVTSQLGQLSYWPAFGITWRAAYPEPVGPSGSALSGALRLIMLAIKTLQIWPAPGAGTPRFISAHLRLEFHLGPLMRSFNGSFRSLRAGRFQLAALPGSHNR